MTDDTPDRGETPTDQSTDRSTTSLSRRTALRAAAALPLAGVLGTGPASGRRAPPLAVQSDALAVGEGGPDALAAASSLEPGRTATAALAPADADTYAVDLSGGTFDVDFSREGRGSFGLLLYGPDGRFLDALAVGESRSLSQTRAAAAGAHYLRVVNHADTSGSYSLAVSERPPADTDAPAGPYVAIEAESASGGAEFAPFEVRSDGDASGGRYVTTPDEGRNNYDGPPSEGVAEYTVSVPADDEYTLWARGRGQSRGNTFYVTVDGDTEEWHMPTGRWLWADLRTVPLSEGEHTVRVRYREDGTDLDRLLLTADGSYTPSGTGPAADSSGWSSGGGSSDGPAVDTQAPYGDSPVAFTDRVEAERFDVGGEGVSFHDSTDANLGGAVRSTGVDVESSAGGGHNIGWMTDGEWLEYTVDAAPGTYDLSLRVAAKHGGSSIRVLLDGAELGVVDVPKTGGWQSWTTVTLPDVSVEADGESILRVEAVGGWRSTALYNLNWLSFAPADSGDGDDSGMDGGGGSEPNGHPDMVDLSGERKRWHDVTLSVDGPWAAETGDPNPFTDYRFEVAFTSPRGRTKVVPGYFAADGNAADSGATSGSTWRAHLMPDETGRWNYELRMVRGDGVAIGDGGSPVEGVDSATGWFTVSESDKAGRDFRGRGLLSYTGTHYLRFEGDDTDFLKVGAGSPENFLGYEGFDNTENFGETQGSVAFGLHEFGPHVSDWSSGDPTWDGGRGKGIVGLVNYLASEGLNSQYFMTYTVDGGDGQDTYPWLAPDRKRRFDVSKLAQWEVVFSHMTRRGIAMNLYTQETENDNVLSGGSLGEDRRLYYRELVARFGHHPALVWNLGEENTNSDAERRAFADYITQLDPYDHPVAQHTSRGRDGQNNTLGGITGADDIDAAALQGNHSNAYDDVRHWRDESDDAGRPWVVFADEVNDWNNGVPADGYRANGDGYGQADVRKDGLWGTFMAGGGGWDTYFGWGQPWDQNDITAEDLRAWDGWWDYCAYAHAFFTDNFRLSEMRPRQDLVGRGYCLGGDGEYALYLPDGGGTSLDVSGDHTLRWYNPRTGEYTDGRRFDGGWTGSAPFGGDAAAVIEER